MPTAVRPSVEDDQRAIMAVRVATWRAAYTGILDESVFEELDRADLPSQIRLYRAAVRAGMRVTVAETPADGVIGFCAFGRARVNRSLPDETSGPAPGSGAGEVYALCVHPDHWGRGTGAALIDDAVGQLHGIGHDPVVLWTFEANDRARRFYERLGFRPDGTRRRFRMDDGPGGPGDPVEVRYVLDRPTS